MSVFAEGSSKKIDDPKDRKAEELKRATNKNKYQHKKKKDSVSLDSVNKMNTFFNVFSVLVVIIVFITVSYLVIHNFLPEVEDIIRGWF